MDSTTAITRVEKALPIQTMSELATIGELLAQSGMFGVNNAAAGFVVAATCHQQGISLMEFQRTYHVIDNKPSMRADAMLAEFRKRGGRVKILENSVTRAAAEFEFEGQKLPFAFTMEDATRTGDCLGKDGKLKHNWQRRSDDMLWARMVSRAIRRLCPEIVSGIYTPEEMEDATPEKAPRKISQEEAISRAKTVTPEVTPPTSPDYSICPLEAQADGKSVKGMKWSEMPEEWLHNALELPDNVLSPEYKAAIKEVVPF